MAAGDLVQKGTVVKVGFGGVTYTGFVMQGGEETPTLSEVEEIMGDQGATVTEIYTNPGRSFSIEGVVKNAASNDAELTAIRALVKGSPLTVNSIACRVDNVRISYGAKAARCTIDVIKRDSMTHS